MAKLPPFSPIALLRRLSGAGVDFVVIGGVAMVLHGSARLTQDLDIVYATDDANLDTLGGLLVELGARLRGIREPVPFVPDGRTLRAVEILTLATDLGPLDLQRAPPGAPPYAELRGRAEAIPVAGLRVLIAALEDLERMKRSAGRARDLEDLETIEAIRRLRGS